MSDGSPTPRELAPAVYSAGGLYVAPADYDRIFCLEASSGRKLWESEPMERTVHLLGVARERLIVTTLDDIRALDSITGRPLRDWLSPGAGDRLPPLGRGLLAGDLVLWPTVEGLRALDQETSAPAANMACNYTRNAIHGNLALGEGCLVAADATHVHAYVSPRWFLEQRQREASRDPRSAIRRLELGLAEAAAGQFDAALRDVAYAERAALANDRWQDQPLKKLAQSSRHSLLLDGAKRETNARRWDHAAAYLTEAAAADFTVSQRLQAVGQQAELWTAAGQPTKALASWQQILEDDRLRRAEWPETITDGFAEGAGRRAAQHISEILLERSPDQYAPIERRAQDLLRAAKGATSSETLIQLAARFPHARGMSDALLEWASASDRSPAQAAQAYRLLLRQESTAATRDAAQEGLARAYERLHCRDAARPFCLMPPLVRAWQLGLPLNSNEDAETSVRLLVPSDEHAFAGLGRLFFVGDQPSKSTLICRDAATNKMCWEQALAFSPAWLSRHADIVLVAGRREAQGLRLEDGAVLWHAALPFADEEASAAGCSWQLAGGRLFVLQERRRFVALDADDGSVLWSRCAPGALVRPLEPAGRYHPFFHAGEQWLVTQTSGGRCCVYDSRTGRHVHELAAANEPWPRPPVVVDAGRVCVLDDCCRIVLLDLARGKGIWSHDLPRPSASMEAPRLAKDGASLLALIDGWQLDRVDLQTGKSLWLTGEPRWASGWTREPWRPAFQEDTAYFVRGNVLYAYALADGKRLWEHPLPVRENAWGVVASSGHLVVYPSQLQSRLRLPWKGVVPALPIGRPSGPCTFAVLVYRAKDGQFVQRLDFPVEDSDLAVQILERDAIFAASNQVWRLAPKNAP
jgi:outer membrane protein assembly factor BamB